MRGSQVAQPTSRGDICGPLNWGQRFPWQKENEAMGLERGLCQRAADFYNREQNLKAFSLPHSLLHHISFDKATNSGWLSLLLHSILLSQLLCRKIENCFHCLISVPGKGKGASSLLSASCLSTVKRWKQGPWARAAALDPQSVCKD